MLNTLSASARWLAIGGLWLLAGVLLVPALIFQSLSELLLWATTGLTVAAKTIRNS